MILPDSVSLAHAPIPTNDSEQLLFRQLFQTLVWLDCQGNVRPGAAVAWSPDSVRRVWAFTLRSSSLRSAPSTEPASEIVSGWQHRPADLRALGVESATAEGEDLLSVRLGVPIEPVPRRFADPALALSRELDSSSIQLLDDGVLSRTPSGLVHYRIEPGADPRDLLDRGADLMVSRDPALVEYANGKPAIVTFALPWSRTYVLLQPAGAEPVPASAARDAVKGDVRRAEPPFWWEERGSECVRTVPSSVPASARVVYLRGDEAARGLAERIVALAASDEGLRTAALGASEFSSALAGGGERAYIIALPRQTLAPCRDSAGWPSGATLHPLIDTRAYALVRRGAPSLAVEWDGTLRLHPERPEDQQ